MWGELRAVWRDSYREIWNPLFGGWEVHKDIYVELYQELDKALDDISETPFSIHLNDALHLKEAFEKTLAIANVDIDRDLAERKFFESNVTELKGASERRAVLEVVLIECLEEEALVSSLLNQVLHELADNSDKKTEARKRALESILNDPEKSEVAFEAVSPEMISSEMALIQFFESAFEIINDYGGEEMANQYFNLLVNFIQKFNLRYDIRRPCALCPTIPGLFSSLLYDLSNITSQDAHLDSMMKDFQNAIRDLKQDSSEGRIKTCIQKQFNLLEAIASRFPGVKNSDLMGICGQLTTWPHKGVRSALGSLYGFACEYPGIRHGGKHETVLRPMDMRDLIALSVLLAGFTPYLSNEISPDLVYGRN